MKFKLLNELSFNLNNQFFFLTFFTIKILSKDNMKRNFSKNRGVLIKLEIYKKVRELEKIFYFFLKSDN